MPHPTSTYRLQFRDGMTFEKAVAMVPYLERLGISHLYASPIFTATSGSTHGYDVTDPVRIDPVLGGRDGFQRLSEAAQAAGIRLLLDIVPNHMAASLENSWWRDVIEWGHASRHADCFDIDWEQRLTLPFLGEDFAEAAAAGNISVRADRTAGCLALCYFDTAYPLNPSTYAHVLHETGEGTRAVVTLAQQASAEAEEIFHAAMRALLAGPAGEEIDAALAAFSEGVEPLCHLHDLQSYKLIDWHLAPQGLAYRRFFEITGLVGLRIEDPRVFDRVHAEVFALLEQGLIHGIRIDHIDGLADPKTYLDMLRQRIGADTYLIVEKILEGGEALPPDWPVQGTTGYEFITALNATLADAEGVDAMETAYESLSAHSGSPEEALRNAKLLMIQVNFAGEVAALQRALLHLARVAAGYEAEAKPFHDALEALLVAFPVYRTYGTTDGLGERDTALLNSVCETAAAHLDGAGKKALRQIAEILARNTGPEAAKFRTRFQQLTGPLMAKALEDTAFYRHSAFLALNEVGGSLKVKGEPLPDFHSLMLRRQSEQPLGLSATATHDTKRGEDARARLLTLSEDPASWIAGVSRWSALHADGLVDLKDGAVPEAETAWMIYQALAGVWPSTEGDLSKNDCQALSARLHAFLEKAMREAKRASNWSAVNEAYETAVQAYASRLLDPDNEAFRADFSQTLAPFVRAGHRNSLSQTILKLTAPGIPDIYQGSECLDLSLVDPDNRRMPDYAALSASLEETAETDEIAWTEELLASGRIKQQVIRRLLGLRRRFPDLFAGGDYHPLVMEGENRDHLIGFLRRQGSRTLVAVVPRLTRALSRSGSHHHGEGRTRVVLPDDLLERRFLDLFTNRVSRLPDRDPTVSGFAAEGYSLLVDLNG